MILEDATGYIQHFYALHVLPFFYENVPEVRLLTLFQTSEKNSIINVFQLGKAKSYWTFHLGKKLTTFLDLHTIYLSHSICLEAAF